MIHSDSIIIENVPLPIEGGNPTAVKVDGSAVTQPVSGSVSVSGSVTVGNFPATQPVSGSVSVSNFPATQPVSGTVSVGNVVSVITAVASNAVLTIITQPSNLDTMLLAANANRKSAIIFLPKSGTTLKYGTGASASSFTTKTGATNTTLTITGYTGQINSFGPGDTINVTELS